MLTLTANIFITERIADRKSRCMITDCPADMNLPLAVTAVYREIIFGGDYLFGTLGTALCLAVLVFIFGGRLKPKFKTYRLLYRYKWRIVMAGLTLMLLRG